MAGEAGIRQTLLPRRLTNVSRTGLSTSCHIGLKAPDEARRTLDKILAFQPGGHKNDSGQIIRALALKQSGRTAEGRALVQALLKQDPDNKLARWAAGVFAGLPAPLPTGLQDINCRVLAALPQ